MKYIVIVWTIFVLCFLLITMLYKSNTIRNIFLKKKTVYRMDEVGWCFKEIIRSDGCVVYRKTLTIEEYKCEKRKQKLERIVNG